MFRWSIFFNEFLPSWWSPVDHPLLLHNGYHPWCVYVEIVCEVKVNWRCGMVCQKVLKHRQGTMWGVISCMKEEGREKGVCRKEYSWGWVYLEHHQWFVSHIWEMCNRQAPGCYHELGYNMRQHLYVAVHITVRRVCIVCKENKKSKNKTNLLHIANILHWYVLCPQDPVATNNVIQDSLAHGTINDVPLLPQN